MAEIVQDDGEIFDCSSLSIAYAANGLATISFVVYRDKIDGSPYSGGNASFTINAGGVEFKGYVIDQSLIPASDIKKNEWRVTAIAIGCKGSGLPATC
jgi:hypothetical protein